MSYAEKEKLIKTDIVSIKNEVRHAFSQGYDLGFEEGKKRAKLLEQDLRKGHWIKYECGLKCSECHSNPLDFVDTVDDNDNAYMSTPMPYCPNCGKKMIEPQESEDQE